MKSLYGITSAYRTDHNDEFVPTLRFNSPGGGTEWVTHLIWEQYLSEGLLSSLACPSQRTDRSLPSNFKPDGTLYYNIGFNGSIAVYGVDGRPFPIVAGTDDSPTRYSQIENPSKRFYFADGNNSLIFRTATDGTFDPYAPSYRHNGNVNMCFLDGHVESVKGPIPNPPLSPWK